MAATPQNGTLNFKGQSGKVYAVSVYNPDVSGSFLTMSATGSATSGSQNFWIAPELVTIEDFSVTTGIADTKILLPQANDVSIPGIIQWANILNTLAFRSFPKLSYRAGTKITFTCA